MINRPESFYNIWLNKFNPIFIILSRYSSIFSLDIIFPIEIIHYILFIYLKIEQQLLDTRFRCTCFEKECILNWWKIYDRDIPLTNKLRAYPKHCLQKGCHKITYEFSINCKRCSRIVCHECPQSMDDNNYFNINNEHHRSFYYLCIYCQEEIKISKGLEYLPKRIYFDNDRTCVSCLKVKNSEFSIYRCDYCDKKFLKWYFLKRKFYKPHVLWELP